MLPMVPAKQTSNVDLVLVPQEIPCPASAQSLLLCGPVFHTQNTDANRQILGENNQAGTKHS